MTELFNLIGSIIAVLGSTFSILGVLMNNLYLQHHSAMRLWQISNPLLLIWAIGFSLGLWMDGLSGLALIFLYGVFTITNWYGLKKKEETHETKT